MTTIVEGFYKQGHIELPARPPFHPSRRYLLTWTPTRGLCWFRLIALSWKSRLPSHRLVRCTIDRSPRPPYTLPAQARACHLLLVILISLPPASCRLSGKQ